MLSAPVTVAMAGAKKGRLHLKPDATAKTAASNNLHKATERP